MLRRKHDRVLAECERRARREIEWAARHRQSPPPIVRVRRLLTVSEIAAHADQTERIIRREIGACVLRSVIVGRGCRRIFYTDARPYLVALGVDAWRLASLDGSTPSTPIVCGFYYSPEAIASLLTVTPQHVRNILRVGAMPCLHHHSAGWRVEGDQLMAYLAALRVSRSS